MKILLDDAIVRYQTHRKSLGLSKNTLANGTQATRALMTSCGNIYVHNISDQHVSRMFEDLASKRQASSLRATHSLLNNFFEYCERNEFVRRGRNPLTDRRRPKPVAKERHRIPVYRFPQLLSMAEAHDPRDRAVVAVGLFALLRDQEMASLRIRDIDLGTSRLFARVTKSHLEDLVPISKALDIELRRWFVAYQKDVGPLRPDFLLLPTVVTRPVRDAGGRMAGYERICYDPQKPILKSARIVTPILAELGVEVVDRDGHSTREGAHTLRRSGARAMYDAMLIAGHADALRLVQVMLHHASIEQTQHYIGLSPDKERRDSIISKEIRYGFEDISTIGEKHDSAVA